MPYIKEKDRPKFNRLLNESGEIKTVGELNYVITKLCLDFLRRQGCNYSILNGIVGVLTCVQMEFYRRKISIYEDKKIQENGDVF